MAEIMLSIKYTIGGLIDCDAEQVFLFMILVSFILKAMKRSYNLVLDIVNFRKYRMAQLIRKLSKRSPKVYCYTYIMPMVFRKKHVMRKKLRLFVCCKLSMHYLLYRNQEID